MQVYNEINSPILSIIKGNEKRILDCGCGTGVLGEAIKKQASAHVVGITHCSQEHDAAMARLDSVILGDLLSFDLPSLGRFEYIICSHVLEHLSDPWSFLARLHSNLSDSGSLIVALPNTLYWKQRIEFIRGRFRYTDQGILDRSHLRFFDYVSARQMIHSSGFRVTECTPIGHFPLPFLRRFIPGIAKKIDKLALIAFPGLFADQFLFIAASNKQAAG